MELNNDVSTYNSFTFNELIYNNYEIKVYRATYEGSSVIVKTSEDPEILHYEFLVGKQINTLENFTSAYVKTYAYFEYNNIGYLVLEDIRGKKLSDYIKDKDRSDVIHLLSKITRSLIIAQRRLHFTHYDLHCGNIIIDNEDNPRIIDFGSSHLDDLPDGIYLRQSSFDQRLGIVASIFDPLIDIVTLIKDLNRYGFDLSSIIDQKRLFEDNNLFPIFDPYFEILDLPHIRFISPDRVIYTTKHDVYISQATIPEDAFNMYTIPSYWNRKNDPLLILIGNLIKNNDTLLSLEASKAKIEKMKMRHGIDITDIFRLLNQ